MIQQTSINAYMLLVETTGLGEMQLKVLKAFRIYGNSTNKEIAHKLNLPINSITPRTNELVKAGILGNMGTKLQQNKRRAIVWGII